ADTDIKVYAIGRKLTDSLKNSGYTNVEDRSMLSDRPDYAGAAALAEELTGIYLKEEVDQIVLVYNHYVSTAVQKPSAKIFLPLALEMPEEKGMSTGRQDYILEPDAESLIAELLPKVLKLKIYTVLLDANAAEHAARTVAMQTATDNGNQLLQELSLQYNKKRQQAITDELLDIVGGSMA
ncbi:MAG: F0F1 ATP synthase subunit gamma, partial [Bacteroidales bacterium]|nr:F0F1 ATP synthase subunit gamma [Bacteroidales bacterium]